MMFTIKQAAERVGISEGLLILWISTAKFKPSVELSTRNHNLTGLEKKAFETLVGPDGEAHGWHRFHFSTEDVERLTSLVEQTSERKSKVESTHVKGSHYSVKDLAALWGVSQDTIRRQFESEPDVIVLGNKNTRGRRRLTLRIPEAVAQRVQRRLANT